MRRPVDDVVARQKELEAAEVIAHVALGGRDHTGRPAHHVITGEEPLLLDEGVADVVRDVPGCGEALDGPPLPADEVTVVAVTSGTKSVSPASSNPSAFADRMWTPAVGGAPVCSWRRRAAGEWSRWVWVHQDVAHGGAIERGPSWRPRGLVGRDRDRRRPRARRRRCGCRLPVNVKLVGIVGHHAATSGESWSGTP